MGTHTIEQKIINKKANELEEQEEKGKTPNQVAHIDDVKEELELIKASADLKPIDYRILNYLSLGHTISEASTHFHRCIKYVVALLKKDAAQIYSFYLAEGYKDNCYARKDDIIRDLYIRFQNANNKDAIGLVKIMAELSGWTNSSKQTNIDININWSDDPWSDNKTIEGECVSDE